MNYPDGATMVTAVAPVGQFIADFQEYFSDVNREPDDRYRAGTPYELGITDQVVLALSKSHDGNTIQIVSFHRPCTQYA